MEWIAKLQTLLQRRDRDARVYQLGLVIAAVVVTGSTWSILSALWVGGAPPVRGAIVGGAFTLLAAIGGVLVLAWQLRQQAENTAKANRHNEAMKLKKDVYEEAQPVIDAAGKAQQALDWCIRRFLLDIQNVRKLSEWVPKTNGTELMKDYEACHTATQAAVALADKWRIIDPRLAVVRMGFLSALMDLRDAYAEYSRFALDFMAPEGLPPRISSTRPNAEEHAKLEQLTDSLSEAIVRLHNYSYDFEVELQNALLGELFGRQLSPRVPRDSTDKVLRLEDEVALRKYFLEETSWGRSLPLRVPPLSTPAPGQNTDR